MERDSERLEPPSPVEPAAEMRAVRDRVRARHVPRVREPFPELEVSSDRGWHEEFLRAIVYFRESATFDLKRKSWRSKLRTRLLRLFPFYSRYAEDLLARLAHAFNTLGEISQHQTGQSAVLSRLESETARLTGIVDRLQHETAVGFPRLSDRPASALDGPLSPADATFYAREPATEEDLRRKFRSYLDEMPPVGPVLEIGPGAGIFLEVCREAGIRAWGLDASPAAVSACRRKELDVELGSVPGYLRCLPEASVTALAAFQVVEHLPLKHLYDLLRSAYRLLTPSGILLLETINPESCYAVGASYMRDPSHRTLLHPRTLSFLAERFGFLQPRIRYSLPLDVLTAGATRPPTEGDPDPELREAVARIAKQVFGFHDYALIARKPPKSHT